MKKEVSREDVLAMMAGKEELEALEAELKEFERSDTAPSSEFEAGAAAQKAVQESQ